MHTQQQRCAARPFLGFSAGCLPQPALLGARVQGRNQANNTLSRYCSTKRIHALPVAVLNCEGESWARLAGPGERHGRLCFQRERDKGGACHSCSPAPSAPGPTPPFTTSIWGATAGARMQARRAYACRGLERCRARCACRSFLESFMCARSFFGVEKGPGVGGRARAGREEGVCERLRQ